MAEYYYLVSSLPELAPEAEPSERMDAFMESCGDWLSVGEMAILSSLSLTPELLSDETTEMTDTIALWYDWETCLRNRIVRQRSGSGQEMEMVLRYECDYYSEIESGVMEAWAQPDPKERERALDLLRWRYLDHLEGGHYFDFARLCIYKLKLMLREKWRFRQVEPGLANLDRTLVAIGQRQGEAPVAATE